MSRFIADKARSEKSSIFGLNPNVFFLGLTSLLTDVSSEMIFTLVPLLLCNVLGAATTIVGLVGGISESADALFRIFSGWISDKLRKRKFLATLGYSISTIAKPFMYLASNWGIVLAVRFSDRVGKGIRTSPRDALVADSVAVGERGKGFGLHRGMDTAGAVLGLLIVAIIVYYVQGGGLELGLETYRWLVIVGVIPAVLGVLVLLAFVREKKHAAGSIHYTDLSKSAGGFNSRFKLFLAVMAVFTLGNSSDFFVIMRAQDMGTPLIQVVLMLTVLNVTYAAVSLSAGMLSDRLGRRGVIILGWLIYALVYLGFAVSGSMWQVWLLFACYGLYYGIVGGAARAFVADLVPEAKRGTAYGFYHGVVGLTLLPASLLAGWLWEAVNPAAPFYFGAELAFFAMLGMVGLVRE
ncbi:MFS transporter [Chloroflexota bacterium]